MATISLISVIAIIISCQQPTQIRAELEKQTNQIKLLENKVDVLNAKVEQLMKDFNQHIEDYHKKSLKRGLKARKSPALGMHQIEDNFLVSSAAADYH